MFPLVVSLEILKRQDGGYFSVSMSNQVVYETNADYYASYNSLYNSNEVSFVEQTQKGIIKFGLVRSETATCNLAPNGTLQVNWANEEEKKTLHPIIKKLLIPLLGEELEITALHQQILGKILAPTSQLELYWCNKKYQYERPILNPWLSKNERKAFNLRVKRSELLLEMWIGEQSLGSLFGTPFAMFYKGYPQKT